jgi:probable rRNA maturation factor
VSVAARSRARPALRVRTGIVVDVTAEGTLRAPLSRQRIATLARLVLHAEGVRNAVVSIALLSSRAIARMNRTHLRHSGPTDAIAFPLRSAESAVVLGDIYVCPAVVRANAARYGVSASEECGRVVTHAILHVLGWDHPDDAERTYSAMWRRQEALLRRWSRTMEQM